MKINWAVCQNSRAAWSHQLELPDIRRHFQLCLEENCYGFVNWVILLSHSHWWGVLRRFACYDVAAGSMVQRMDCGSSYLQIWCARRGLLWSQVQAGLGPKSLGKNPCSYYQTKFRGVHPSSVYSLCWGYHMGRWGSRLVHSWVLHWGWCFETLKIALPLNS